MQKAEIYLDIHHDRGLRGLPLERVEDTLGPTYNRGETRRVSPAYTRIRRLIALARAEGNREAVIRLKAERRKIQCAEPCEWDYRRLRYVRYADDFRMASNVSRRMGRIFGILRTSLLKTLASKHKCLTSKIRRMYRVPDQEYTKYRVTVNRPGKEPLVATFGGMSLRKNPDGMGKDGFDANTAWFRPVGKDHGCQA